MLIKNILSKILFFNLALNFIFAQVEIIGDQSFTITQSNEQIILPLFSNKEIHEPDSNIDRAVIVIHGMNRNAEDYYNSIYDNAVELNVLSETIIIAPQFLITLDLNHWQPINEYVFWSGTTSWSSGGQSNSTNMHPRNYDISSFSLMDSLISHLLSNFSNLQDIVLVGNSAGGQFVNRYAAGSDQEGDGIIRYVVSAPSSYLYFDENRYNDYQLPFSWSVPQGCIGYNDYKYGLNDLNEYMESVGIDSIRARYSRRNVQYLVGTYDTGGTQDCESMAQGSNRLERAIIYYNHLMYFFGIDIVEKQKLALIPEIGHNFDNIASAQCGNVAIFNLGNCEQFQNVSYPTASFTSQNNSGVYPHAINFINESDQGTYPIQQFVWNIGNEIIYSNGSINYTFGYPGIFDVSLMVIDQIGFSDTLVYDSYVEIDTLYGDIDWDAEVLENDASLILQNVIGNASLSNLQETTGDVSNSQSLNPFDASLIMQYIAGSIDRLPINNLDLYASSGLLNTPNIFGEEDEIITIPVSLINASNIYSFTISFDYNNTHLESGLVYSDVNNDHNFIIESSITDSGSIYIAGASSMPFEGETVLFNLYFIPSMIEDGFTVIECTKFMLNEAEIISTQDFDIVINQSLEIKNEVIPNSITLYDNYPNPFNKNTIIKYSQKNNEFLKLYITDINGSMVKVLHDNNLSKKNGVLFWDGTNNFGLKVNSGMYFYTLETSHHKKTKKMLLLK